MVTINPYLNFDGNAEEAFNFYKSVFGGEFKMLSRFKDTTEAGKVLKEEENKLMHISLPFGNGNVLMASDVLQSMGFKINPGNNFYLAVSADSDEQATNFFNKLSTDGKITMPLQKTFWGAYFGMLKDKFGVQWMISHDQNMQS